MLRSSTCARPEFPLVAPTHTGVQRWDVRLRFGRPPPASLSLSLSLSLCATLQLRLRHRPLTGNLPPSDHGLACAPTPCSVCQAGRSSAKKVDRKLKELKKAVLPGWFTFRDVFPRHTASLAKILAQLGNAFCSPCHPACPPLPPLDAKSPDARRCSAFHLCRLLRAPPQPQKKKLANHCVPCSSWMLRFGSRPTSRQHVVCCLPNQN